MYFLYIGYFLYFLIRIYNKKGLSKILYHCLNLKFNVLETIEKLFLVFVIGMLMDSHSSFSDLYRTTITSKCEKMKYVSCIIKKAIKNLYVLQIPVKDVAASSSDLRGKGHPFLPKFRNPVLPRPEYGCSFQNGWQSVMSLHCPWSLPSFLFCLLYKPLLESNKKVHFSQL